MATKKKPAGKKLTKEMKALAFALLRGDSYLKQRGNRKGKMQWCIYKDNANPQLMISDRAYNRFAHLYRIDAKGKTVLNLQLVRQEHGKSHIKKTYKNLKTTITV